VRRTLAVGVALAGVYVAMVAATAVMSGRPVVPLFDGLTPPPPYRWVKPPPGNGTNVKPQATGASLRLAEGGSVLDQPTGVNGQVVLNLPERAVPGRPAETAVTISFTPLDPHHLGDLPAGFVADGNAYRIRMRYGRSGADVGDMAVAGNVILSTPEPASVLLFSADGDRWDVIPTQRVGGPDAVGGPFYRPGHYVAALPGRTIPGAHSRTWLQTTRRILIVLLSAALVVNLAFRVRAGRRAARQAAKEHVM
jgi:hypothetical protein